MKHSHVVLNLTGLSGLARQVVAQNVIKILHKLGYGVQSEKTLSHELLKEITFIAVCLECGSVHYTKSTIAGLFIPQGVQVYDATYEYSGFVTVIREAVEKLEAEIKTHEAAIKRTIGQILAYADLLNKLDDLQYAAKQAAPKPTTPTPTPSAQQSGQG